MFEAAVQDLRFGLRILRRQPGVSALVVICLTLGVGANAAVFSWIEGILFRPYPLVAHQDRLVALTGSARGEARGTELSWPDVLDVQRGSTLLESVFVSKITGTTLSIGERAQTATGSIVSANYFDAIGVRPTLGRGFEPGEDVGRRAHPVVVISYDLWQKRFNGDPAIVGRTQRLAGELHTIVGVTPEGFYGTFVGWAMQFWVPASQEELFEAGGYKLEDRGARWAEAYAFLKPGVTREQAQAELSALAQRLEAAFPDTNRGQGATLWPLWKTPFNNASTLLPTLEIMLAVTAFVLLIASANVANLLLVRSLARAREMTVRLAIGAGQGRLFRQLFTEGLLLSGLGAAAGLAIAYACRQTLGTLLPSRGGVSMHLIGALDWRVLALSAAIGVVVTLVVGLVPALQARRIDLVDALKAGSTSVVGGRGQAWVRAGLIVVQVSLSFVLLVGGSLLLQSLQRIRSASPGFDTREVLNTAVPLAAAGYSAPRGMVFEDALIDRLLAVPGVTGAAFARVTPLGYGTYSEAPIAVTGYVPAPDEQRTVLYNQIGPGYFGTMGIRLRSGREFTRVDDERAPLVAVVNETMAARYWRGADPVGQRFLMGGKPVEVVGIAADTKYESMREAPRALFYTPRRQTYTISGSLNLRTSRPLREMAPVIAREVRALDAALAPYEVISLQDQLDRSTSPQLVAVTLVGVLAGFALLLAAIGLYGVMSYVVSQSAGELRLRMALGAASSNLLRLVMGRGLRLAAAGLLLGVIAAQAMTRLLGNLLYGTSPRDPVSFASTVAVILATAALACLVPALRAARTDLVKGFRQD